MDANGVTQLYNAQLRDLAAETSEPYRLENPDITETCVSVICGSSVTIDLKVEKSHILDIGYDIDGCNLTKASMAILKNCALGKGHSDIQNALTSLENILTANGPLPDNEWKKMAVLEPARDYTARHDTILLPFRTTLKALESLK